MQRHGLVQMGRYTIVMMDWHPIPMNPYTPLATLVEGLLLSLTGISMKELLLLVLVVRLVPGQFP